MIGHQAIGGDADLGLSLGFGEDVFKGGVVSGLLEQRQSPDATVEDVIGEVSPQRGVDGVACGSSTEPAVILSRKDSRPLFLSLFLSPYPFLIPFLIPFYYQCDNLFRFARLV